MVATISLFHVVHDWNRNNIPNYFEIYLDTPMSELKRRDSKGIYSRYEAGEIKNVAGLDLQIEKPTNPDLTISFGSKNTDDLYKLEILKKIKNRPWWYPPGRRIPTPIRWAGRSSNLRATCPPPARRRSGG